MEVHPRAGNPPSKEVDSRPVHGEAHTLRRSLEPVFVEFTGRVETEPRLVVLLATTVVRGEDDATFAAIHKLDVDLRLMIGWAIEKEAGQRACEVGDSKASAKGPVPESSGRDDLAAFERFIGQPQSKY